LIIPWQGVRLNGCELSS